ncbi:MAG TPA: DMT family transporter [Polyangia bacterium]|nr:DMT family transporter [Polyangia bacterium]
MARPVPSAFRGALFALAAAVSFGITTPVVALAGRGVGPLTTAALLYLGACLSGLLLMLTGRTAGTPLARTDGKRLILVALFGAALAPALLAWGLQRSGGTVGSLLLNLEAVFTVLLARAFYREPIGLRVAAAVTLMTAAATLLAATSTGAGGFRWSGLGALAVGGATLAWALDNTLTRPLASHDPVTVVAAKGALGAALTVTLAFALREPWPHMIPMLVLLACGATGYGLSLRFYLLAQRRIGAARTASIFALAPFVGAVLGWTLGDRVSAGLTTVAAALFGAGVFLHVTDQYRRRPDDESAIVSAGQPP